MSLNQNITASVDVNSVSPLLCTVYCLDFIKLFSFLFPKTTILLCYDEDLSSLFEQIDCFLNVQRSSISLSDKTRKSLKYFQSNKFDSIIPPLYSIHHSLAKNFDFPIFLT